MNTQILSFGKFKGQRFCDTPEWYQTWLNKQDWFNKPKVKREKPFHKQLKGWDGHGRKGQAIYDQIFEQEKEDQEKYDPSDRYGHYVGI